MSKQSEGASELFLVRNNLYLGNYSQCISMASEIKLAEQHHNERDILLYRANIGLGQYEYVLSEIKDDKKTSVGLRSVRILAEYFVKKELSFDSYLVDPIFSADATFLTVIASIYIQEGNYTEAIKYLKDPSTLEHYSLLVTCFLRIYRLDLAENALKKMSDINDDATITQLTTAWFYLAKEKFNEAETLFGELLDKYGESVVLLNGKALVYMHQQSYEKANKILVSALAKRSQDSETLINLIVSSLHLQKPNDLIKRYVNQLKSTAPQHPWVKKYNLMELDFDSMLKK
jgi:coatomer protein complex subunit epsilon